MLAVNGFKGCRRCGGDLFEEPGLEQHDIHVRYVSCLQCGELHCIELPAQLPSLVQLRGRPGRPRKVRAV
jgi:hypothetical protein